MLLFGCEKNIPAPTINTPPKSFSAIFEDFWNDMNIDYVYWDIDTTNWDKVYNFYKPVFAKLDINDPNDVQKSVVYFQQMTGGLIDSHYRMTFSAGSIANTVIFPALDRKVLSPTFHSPFLYSSIDTVSYLDKNFISGHYFSMSNQETIYALAGTINSDILYFYCNGFALKEAYQSQTANNIQSVLKYFFNTISNLPLNIKGIVIDIRNNSGGNIEDLNFLLGRLISKPLQFGYTRYKSGNGRLQYTPWITASIMPATGAKAINLPIIALADNYSISLAEATTMAIHAMPNGTFVGETTWGATGPITSGIIYNDGPFTIGNFLSVGTSSGEFKYIDGQSYEGKGFPPDVDVPFNFNLLYSGIDPQLEKAISLIK
jgi:carboxyl-terminal processing protease